MKLRFIGGPCDGRLEEFSGIVQLPTRRVLACSSVTQLGEQCIIRNAIYERNGACFDFVGYERVFELPMDSKEPT